MNKIFKGITKLSIISMMISPISCFALNKTETIYSNLNSDGVVKNTTINVGLTNLDKGDVIDYSKLSDIENVNGYEKFSKDSDKLIWKSKGKDIYYKGKLNNDLPITVSTKYYLDGKEMKLSEMNGKSGNVKLVFNFKNNSYDYNYHMYTPFVVTTVSMIDSKNNSNVEVSNGKVINTGNKNVLTAISAPGLYESTNIDELAGMDKVTISYNTTKFSMSEVYFVITPKLLDDVDISNISKVSNISSSLNTLSNGVIELQNGSKAIVDGENTLYNGLVELNNGINSALVGSDKIYQGLVQVNEGVAKFNSLSTLVDTLYSTYNENSILLNNINTGVTKEQLENGIADATQKKTALETQLTQVNGGIAALEQIDEEVITDEQKAQLETLKGQKAQLEAGIAQYAAGISNAQTNLASLPLAAAKISGANEVIIKVLCGVLGVSDPSLISEEAINNFKLQINTLTGGIGELTNGAKELNEGMNKLSEGSNKLVEGQQKLSEGNQKLLDGITKLNNEGISKLNEYGNKISNYSNKVETLINLSKNYKGFSSDNVNKTIFIYKLSK